MRYPGGVWSGDDLIRSRTPIKRRDTRSAHAQPRAPRIAGIARRKKFRCPVVHRFCTFHAQDFHNAARERAPAQTLQYGFACMTPRIISFVVLVWLLAA